MKVEDFVAITKDLCGFPSFFNAPFFRRILASLGDKTLAAVNENAAAVIMPPPVETPTDDDAPRITKEVFQAYWTKELAPYDSVERFFRVVSIIAVWLEFCCCGWILIFIICFIYLIFS